MPTRVGFLFNHYFGHQVPHAAPIAFELSRRYPRVSVQIIGSDRHILDVVQKLSVLYPGERCERVLAHVPVCVAIVDPLVKGFMFLRKKAVLRNNRDLFRRLDILVVPEVTSLLLKREPGLGHLKFVYTHHGSGDRAGSFYRELAGFDLVLTAGHKICDRLIRMGLVDERRCRIVGYPKFEVNGALSGQPKLFDNGKPTVLYNPHFERGLSSWSPMGKAVLDFFKRNTEYNLIFAPHVILYQRQWRHGARSLHNYRTAPNIHLDTGSLASIDMTYTTAADIYLGDVSSQVYEFLLRPRPCIFLNAHNVVRWERDENYRFWHAGEVVNRSSALPDALARAHDVHPRYVMVQKQLFDETFDMSAVPPSVRAADAIAEFIGLGSSAPSGQMKAPAWSREIN